MNDDSKRSWPWLTEIVIDRNDATPPVEQIANAIRNKIATGLIRASDVLPSVRVLASSVGTTPATVSRTYQLLQREGLVTTVSGVGTVVVDVENLQQSARTGMLNAAGQVLDNALHSLVSLGLGEQDLERLLQQRGERLGSRVASLVFVVRRHINLELYRRQLREMATGLPIKIHCIPLEDLENREEAAIAAVESATVVTSLVTYKRLLATLIPSTLEVHYIIAEVVMEAVEALMALPEKTNVALVSSGSFRTVGLGILHTYCRPERIYELRGIDDEALKAIPADTVIVHTYRYRELAAAALPNHERICLDFELRADSLNRLRAFITGLLGSASGVPAQTL